MSKVRLWYTILAMIFVVIPFAYFTQWGGKLRRTFRRAIWTPIKNRFWLAYADFVESIRGWIGLTADAEAGSKEAKELRALIAGLRSDFELLSTAFTADVQNGAVTLTILRDIDGRLSFYEKHFSSLKYYADKLKLEKARMTKSDQPHPTTEPASEPTDQPAQQAS